MRLSKNVRQQLLDQNGGFKKTTHYNGNNFSADKTYEIQAGELHIRATGKTSWAGSRYDQAFIADDGQTTRFLRDNLNDLDGNGLE
jgi:hypothetical protein